MDHSAFNEPSVLDAHQLEKVLQTDTVFEHPQALEYNIFGILSFLQNEWTKMGIERSRWEYERAEMQVNLSV